MCGIAGILSTHPLPDLRERLTRMEHAMLHRGPDDGGLYLSPQALAGFANRRLAIRDLSPAGHMPMLTADARLCITYNGELYNAEVLRAELEQLGCVFRSHSDTEVILQGYATWGARIVPRLRGMFAFAILDLRPGEAQAVAFLARDPLGIKPLYYAWSGSALVFASELKTLHAAGLTTKTIDPATLVAYLQWGAIPPPQTIYAGVAALPPGCHATLTLDRLAAPAPVRYWTFPTAESPQGEPAPLPAGLTPAAYVRALLEDAVKSHLVSDVPLGAFLSGGLDSSALVALMRRVTDGVIRTCSIVFEEQSYDESKYAETMARAIGAEHFTRVVRAADLRALLPAALAAMDQPTVDGINSYFVSQTARQAGLTVALSGLGGDELFGGYASTFRGAPTLYARVQALQRIPGAAALSAALVHASPQRHRWARVQGVLARPATLAHAYLARRGVFAAHEARALVHPDVWAAYLQTQSPEAVIQARAGTDTRDPFNWISRAELATYTQHQLLRDTDVMSMAHSLEVRVPLLDTPLVEALLRLPGALKQGVGPKPLLRAALGDLLPPNISARTDKRGFTFPFDVWLAELGAPPVPAGGLLEPAAVAALWRAHRAGRMHWSRPWAVRVLQEWLG